MGDFDMGEMGGKMFSLSEIALQYYRINSMLRDFESRVVLLAILEHAIDNKLDQMDFEFGGKHFYFLEDLIKSNILFEKKDSFEFNEIFLCVLLEFHTQNNLRKILRENIFERIRIPKKLSLSISYYESKSGKYSDDSKSDQDDNIDVSLNIFKFLKTL